MPPAAPQQPQHDNSMSILWTIAAVMAGFAGVWYAFKPQIIQLYLHLKLLEINYFLGFFTNQLNDARDLIQNVLTTGKVGQVSFQDLTMLGHVVGIYLRYPAMILFLIMAVIIFFVSPTRSFKNIYTMRSLAKLEKSNWPHLMPILNLDLVKQDVNKGPWAMALLPMQFCKKYHLLQEFRPEPKEGELQRKASRIEVTLKRGDANRIFSMQLGSVWPGVDRVPPHVRALFAVFAARINGDSEAAAALLVHMNMSLTTKLDFSRAEPLIKKYTNTPIVKRIIQSHAYLLTVMAEMLDAARCDGVQSTADFLWLKPVDRRLWYMLNTVGRQTPFPEVAGPFAHWIAEKRVGRKLLVPMIEEATNALEIALKDIIYQPDEEKIDE